MKSLNVVGLLIAMCCSVCCFGQKEKTKKKEPPPGTHTAMPPRRLEEQFSPGKPKPDPYKNKIRIINNAGKSLQIFIGTQPSKLIPRTMAPGELFTATYSAPAIVKVITNKQPLLRKLNPGSMYELFFNKGKNMWDVAVLK